MTIAQTPRPEAEAETAGTTRPLAVKGALVDLAFRCWIIVLATGAVIIDVPVWARAPLAVAAAALTVMSYLSRSGGRGSRVDAALRVTGAAVVLLAALGLLLSILPGGITAAGWGIGVGAIELVTVIALAVRRSPARGRGDGRRRLPVRAGLWAITISGVLAGALVLSTASFTDTHIAPLALGAERTGDTVEVTVSSGTDAGPYELQLVSDTGTTIRYASGITVGPGSPRTFVFDLVADSRETVRLVETGSTAAIRELTFDTTVADSSVTKDAG